MKKLFMMLSVLSLTGALYAGSACCPAVKTAEKIEKKVCADCTIADKVCAPCGTAKAKVEEKTEEKTEVKTEVKTEEKTEAKS